MKQEATASRQQKKCQAATKLPIVEIPTSTGEEVDKEEVVEVQDMPSEFFFVGKWLLCACTELLGKTRV